MSSLPKKQPTLNSIMGIPIINLPTALLNTLQFDAVNEVFVWVAASAASSMELIETHEAIAPEASFTFSFPAIDFDDVAYLVLEIDGSATAALAIEVRINALATLYNNQGRRLAAGVETFINTTAQTAWQVATSSLITGATSGFNILCKIISFKGSPDNQPAIFADATGPVHANETMVGSQGASTTSITDVVVRTSASTWRIGTRMTLYKVKRS